MLKFWVYFIKKGLTHLPRYWKNGENIEIKWKNLARSWTRSLYPLLPPALPPPPPLTDQPGPQDLQHQHLEVEGQGADGDLQGVLLQPLEGAYRTQRRSDLSQMKM